MFALFTGLAAAQVGSTGQALTCTSNVAVPPQLRAEGFTEQTGDIVISCTGGAPLTAGAVVPTVNIAVTYTQSITSRLFSVSSNQGISEALLLVDEPGAAGLAGYGPQQAQTLCTTPLTGCTAVAGFGPTLNGIPSPLTAVVPGSANGANISTLAPNVYQGVVTVQSGNIGTNQVTFYGVPVAPPTTTGARVYRITNVRVNATRFRRGD